jgi:hypothetical protein
MISARIGASPMRTARSIAFAALGLFVTATPLSAHHAFSAEFDANKPVKLRGAITRVDWINPHSWIHIEVRHPDGKIEKWMVEGGPPGVLVRRGWTKTSLAPGTEILVEGYQAKDGSLRANGRDVTLPDGKKLFLGSSGTGAPDERPEK